MISYISNFIKKLVVSPGVIFLVFMSPVVISVFPDLYEGTVPSSMMVGTISALTLFIVIATGWGYVMNQIKNSSIRVRMKSMGYTDMEIMTMSLIPLLLLVLFSIFYIAIYVTIFYSTGILNSEFYDAINAKSYSNFSIKNINFGALFYSLFTTVLVSVSITFLVVSFNKSQTKYTTIIWLYVLLVYLFGGASAPPNFIRGPDAVKEMEIISYMIPSAYPGYLLGYAVASGNNYGWDWSSSEIVINSLASYGISVAFLGAATWNMKRWDQ